MYEEPTHSDTIGTTEQCLSFIAREVERQSFLPRYIIGPSPRLHDIVHELGRRMIDDAFDSVVTERPGLIGVRLPFEPQRVRELVE